MKIRISFVSNSSSSSFVCIGFDVTDIYKDRLELSKVVLGEDRYNKEWKEYIDEEYDPDSFFYEVVCDIIRQKGFEVKDHPEDGAPDKGHLYICEEISSEEDYSLNSFCMDGNELKDRAEIIREKLNLPKNLQWLLFGGTRCS